MNSWYTVKVKFTKEFTDGTLKRVTEPYLVSSVSFTDAEARIYKEVGEFVRGEFQVTSIAKTDYADIYFYDDADTWYKCKVAYITEDADTGKEKKVNQNFLVSAHSIKEASERIEESMKDMMGATTISAITETQIVDIFLYELPELVEEATAEAAGAVATAEGNGNGNGSSEMASSVNVAFAIGDEEE